VPTLAEISGSVRSQRTEGHLNMSKSAPPLIELLLTRAEVAAMFHVAPATVTKWARAGKLTSIRTIGGHRRYREVEVRDLLSRIPEQRNSGN
jgi:excisionase family DNA binding protein